MTFAFLQKRTLRMLACVLLLAGAFFYSATVHAQSEDNPVCNPGCPSGEYCVFNGDATKTYCTANDTLTTDPNTGDITSQEVVVQAAPTQTQSGGLTFAQIVKNIVTIVSGTLIPLLYALAIIFMFIGIVRYFFIEGGPEAQEKGRKVILYGLIGIVTIFAVWGLVNLLLNTLNSVAGTSGTTSLTQKTQ